MYKMKRFLILVCTTVLAVSVFTGCGSSKPAEDTTEEAAAGAVSVNWKEKLNSMLTSEQELGIGGKYTSVSEITDGKVDPDLLGLWKTADENFTYEIKEDGTIVSSSELYEIKSELPFTCITVGDRKVLCTDATVSAFGEEDEANRPEHYVSYDTYEVDNGALYMVSVDNDQDELTFNALSLVIFYKADESGDISKALEDNPVNPEFLYGDYTYEEGTISIDEKGMTIVGGPEDLGTDPLPIRFDNRGRLIVEAKGATTEYGLGFALVREYEDETKTKLTKKEYQITLSYDAEDMDDRPNLEGIMANWHDEYGYEDYYYDISFSTPAE